MNVAVDLSFKKSYEGKRNEMVSFLNRVYKNPRAPLVGGGLICKWGFMKVNKEVTRWSNQMKVWLPPKVKAIHLAYISPSLSNWMHWEKVVERENAS